MFLFKRIGFERIKHFAERAAAFFKFLCAARNFAQTHFKHTRNFALRGSPIYFAHQKPALCQILAFGFGKQAAEKIFNVLGVFHAGNDRTQFAQTLVADAHRIGVRMNFFAFSRIAHKTIILVFSEKRQYIFNMAETTEWEDTTYAHAFEQEMRGLERRRAYDPNLSVEELKYILESLYISQGNNYVGRGAVADLTLAATIAAYERFIDEWEG